MLARAWAVSEEIDQHFIDLVYKLLALSRGSRLFTSLKLRICRECGECVTGTSIQDSRFIYKFKDVIRILTMFSQKNDIFL